MRFLIYLFFLLLLPSAAFAQETPPVGFCGRGSATACPAPDAAGDGYTTDGSGLGFDCDDTNWQVYPGIYVKDGTDWKLCQDSGAFTATAAFPPTASTGGGSDLYINCDAATNGDGTYANPWNTQSMYSYFYEAEKPAGWRNPVAGDAYWVWGTCNENLDPDGTGTDFTNTYSLYLKGFATPGTATNPITFRNLPGETWTVDAGDNVLGVAVEEEDYLVFDGLECFGTNTTKCIRLTGTTGSEVRNTHGRLVTDGPSDNNVSCLTVDSGVANSEDVLITHSSMRDCYGSTGNAENNTNIDMYRGTGHEIRFSNLYYSTGLQANARVTPARSFKYKHADEADLNATVEIHNNYFWGCGGVCIESGQQGTHIYDNILEATAGKVAINFTDPGGPYNPINILVEQNTILHGIINWRLLSWDTSPSNVVFRRNVFYDDRASYNGENGIITVGTYDSDADYDLGVAALTVDENCYDTANTIGFDFFSSGSNKGALYDWAGWRATDTSGTNNKPAYDTNSFQEDALVNAYGTATSTNCDTFGRRAVSSLGVAPAAAGGGYIAGYHY